MRNFPSYRQREGMDCGPTCLKMISKFYGRNFTMDGLRNRCHLGTTGVSLLGISEAAESIGFRTCGVKITLQQLIDEMPLPAIVHWNQNHFVVVYKVNKKRTNTIIHVADPASGLLTYNAEDFAKSWLPNNGNHLGVALAIEPTPKFYENENETQSTPFLYIFKYLKPYKGLTIQIIISLFIACIFSLVIPFITQSVVDLGIGTRNVSLIAILLGAQLFLAFGKMCNNIIRGKLMLHTSARIGISMITDFLSKMMDLPLNFFENRNVSNIMQRVDDNERVQKFLTGSLLSMVVSISSVIIYSFIMASYNGVVLLIFGIGSILYVSWVLFFLKYRSKLDYQRFQCVSKNRSDISQIIRGISDIKMNNCEKNKRWTWERTQAKLFKLSVKSLELEQVQEVGSSFIDNIKNILISFYTAQSVIEGDMSLGMMMSLQYIIGQINAPISQFVSFTYEAQDASISIDRMNEISTEKSEYNNTMSLIQQIPNNASITLKNISFSYNTNHTCKVIDNISATIPGGKITAIVGASGSGKSTLLKLILGFYTPTEGCVYLANTPLSSYDTKSWRKCCGTVLQEGFIFSDTILSNITMSEEAPAINDVITAASISNIKDWVESLPLGYDTIIGPDGHGLSTGQKQRLLIARAVYKGANYIFLDEATNSLDTNNEKSIMSNLNKFYTNRTVLIIAHRLSTIRNADNIIVMDDGHIVEEGTHESLIEKKGAYYQLVKKQLELETI